MVYIGLYWVILGYIRVVFGLYWVILGLVAKNDNRSPNGTGDIIRLDHRASSQLRLEANKGVFAKGLHQPYVGPVCLQAVNTKAKQKEHILGVASFEHCWLQSQPGPHSYSRPSSWRLHPTQTSRTHKKMTCHHYCCGVGGHWEV